MTTLKDISVTDTRYVKVLDKGFVGLIDHMGSDDAVVQAARVSYGTGTKKVREDRGLIRYLMRHEHTTPFEMCEVKFHIRLPIFVMRQLIRHRTASVNEYSGRYSVMTDEFYVPKTIELQSTTNKQGREGLYSEAETSGFRDIMNDMHTKAYETYERFIEEDMARETARAILPVSNYTETYWKCNLKNFMHMAWLRMDSHAQWEIRMFADAMYGLVQPLFPAVCEAFEDYKLNAVRLSSMEVKLTKVIFGDYMENWDDYITDWYEMPDMSPESVEQAEKGICKDFGLSKRELEEFKKKWM